MWNDELGIQQHGTGFTRDISPGGAFIFGSAIPPEKAEFSMELMLPPLDKSSAAGLRLLAAGHVVRVELENRDKGFAVTSRFRSPAPFDEPLE
jgi:hypothetical protein